MENNSVLWALIGVIIGALLTGIINYVLQLSQFKHNKEMYYLQNKSKESVKETLLELLNHRKFIDRSFKAISARIGGYDDKELRQLLNEVGAVLVNKKDAKDDKNEWWYLKERKEERKKKKKEKADKKSNL